MKPERGTSLDVPAVRQDRNACLQQFIIIAIISIILTRNVINQTDITIETLLSEL